MRYDDDIWDSVRPHAWKWEPRTQPIRLIIIHATRSGIAGRTAAQEYGATVNWFVSPNNGVDTDGRPGFEWGGMTSTIIGGGKICRVMPDDVYPTWSAGHMDPVALSIEIGQNLDGTPFENRDLDLAARYVAEKCTEYNIPPRVLPFVSGDNHEAPGISRHDHSQNGRILGKSDPGSAFDDRAFETRVRLYMEGNELTAQEMQKILDAIKAQGDRQHGDIMDVLNFLKLALTNLDQDHTRIEAKIK